MTDYLEEHLGNAEALLERIRRLEQSASGLPGKAVLKENAEKLDDFAEKTQNTEGKSEIVSEEFKEVYNTAEAVNQLKEAVDNLDIDLGIRGKEWDIAVNYQMIAGDNEKNPGQTETASKAEEAGALSAQLEELDRAVSALTTLTPAGRSSYPIALSASRAPAADPTVTGVPADPTVSGVPAAPYGAGFTYGGTQSWAEQADRLFRRDSRRYDGGFYLY